ncbi:MAG TPA: hypothetical protein VGC60_11165 [Pyrinomonadaceae bacterium]|jgi:hypothetical protein
MANPLTLYVPIKQDPLSQAAATAAAAVFVKNVQAGLDKANIVHYARLALIPNLSGKGILAICLITTFDKAMIPYLDFFWKDPGTHKAFAGVAALALNPPNPPVGNNQAAFEKFITSNNLNKPADLYEAYPDTVAKIKGAPAKPKPPVKGGAKTGSKGGAKKGAKKR